MDNNNSNQIITLVDLSNKPMIAPESNYISYLSLNKFVYFLTFICSVYFFLFLLRELFSRKKSRVYDCFI